jgi:hypothetical protein
LVIIASTPYARYAQLPDELVSGVGLGAGVLRIAWLRDLLVTELGLTFIKWAAVASCLVAMVRPARGVMTCVFAAVLILDQVSKAVSGYPNHAQFVPLASLGVVTLFAMPGRYRRVCRVPVDSLTVERRSKEAIWLCGVVLIIPYTYIGINRLLTSGTGLFAGDAVMRYVAFGSQFYSAYPFGMPLSWLEVWWIAAMLKVGFAVTTMFEVASIAVFWSAWFRATWLVVMSGFHVMTLITMNILFWENLVLMWVVLGWGFLRQAGQSTPEGGPGL